MPAPCITDGDIRGGHGAEVHAGERLIPNDTTKADTMPGVWGGDHHGFYDSTPPLHAWDQTCNQLEPSAGQPDSTLTPGVLCELSAYNKAVPFLLPWMSGILRHVERPMLSIQKAVLGISDQDTGGATQNPP